MIYFASIVLDGFPYVAQHVQVLNRLKLPWHWIIAEGVSLPVRDTSWCNAIPPRLSHDGTHEYLKSLAAHHPNVTHIARPSWDGKTAMFNEMLKHVTKSGLLFQLDVDEIWTANQIETIHESFVRNPQHHWASFFCRYFLGQNIIITSRNCYGNRDGEWSRVWRLPDNLEGLQWERHEPPVLSSPHMQYWRGNEITRHQTEAMGLTFDHYAYATEKQAAFKEVFYQYPGALAQWRNLQANTMFPCRAGDYLRWITDETVCDRLFKV